MVSFSTHKPSCDRGIAILEPKVTTFPDSLLDGSGTFPGKSAFLCAFTDTGRISPTIRLVRAHSPAPLGVYQSSTSSAGTQPGSARAHARPTLASTAPIHPAHSCMHACTPRKHVASLSLCCSDWFRSACACDSRLSFHSSSLLPHRASTMWERSEMHVPALNALSTP